MDKERIAEQLADLLPERESVRGPHKHSDEIGLQAEKIEASMSAKEIARLKRNEQEKIKRAKKQKAEIEAQAEAMGIELQEGQTLKQAQRIAEAEERLRMIEEIEAETVDPLGVDAVVKRGGSNRAITNALKLQGASRSDVTKLLTSLNINLSIQLSKQDTANLVACLLTCNEAQLAALASNKKVPVAIKIVIKRLQEDMKLGNIGTVYDLWDRIFGKNNMMLNLPEEQQLRTGIIPDVPVSREAYIVIRDTLVK